MSTTMGGTHYHTPQTIFQHMMGGQQNNQQDSPQWMQIPQVPPMSMPWVAHPASPNIIRFGEDRQPPCYIPSLHQKRKLDLADAVEMRQHKQFITEEKMAAHFQELHISTKSAVVAEPVPSTSSAYEPIVPSSNTDVDLNQDLDMDPIAKIDQEQAKGSPRLVISEELKRLQHEPILPPSLLSKLERPSMALVLWEPPNKHLRILTGTRDTASPVENVPEENNNTTSANERHVNNNNEGIPNLNAMVTDNDVILEPMDL